MLAVTLMLLTASLISLEAPLPEELSTNASGWMRGGASIVST